MKVSVITAVYNNQSTIRDCLESVQGQSYEDLEHIIVDGGSTDGTVEIIKAYANNNSRFISEPDRGIYDAMNKGLKLAKGDIVGILNSDDVYNDSLVIKKIENVIKSQCVDSCYGDIVYVDRVCVNKVKRYWRSGNFMREKFRSGWMPPHPSFFVKRCVYEKYGYFNIDFSLAADYELMLRFLYKFNLSTFYMPELLVRMRSGGRSRLELLSAGKRFKEIYRSWKVNGLKPGLFLSTLKPLLKLSQYLDKNCRF